MAGRSHRQAQLVKIIETGITGIGTPGQVNFGITETGITGVHSDGLHMFSNILTAWQVRIYNNTNNMKNISSKLSLTIKWIKKAFKVCLKALYGRYSEMNPKRNF
jgi:hypothetical protein